MLNNAIQEHIHINQVGYREGDTKQVMVHGRDGQFTVVERETGKVVFSGVLTGGKMDASSGDTVFYGDFTAVTRPGGYQVVLPGFGISYPFKVGEGVYKEVKNGLLKAFYFQRCGMELEEQYAGKWKHKACHAAPGKVYGEEGRWLDGSGGWHDAGDYGKYTVAAAKALADLMLAYDFFPQSFREDLHIPESGNGVPDLLNEVRYELTWLLKMQDPDSGGVFHKISTAAFPGMDVMPEDDGAALFFSPVSGTATGSYGAVMAMAARVYRPIDRDFAQKCLEAAEKAWYWLEAHPDVPGFRNPDGICTGEYGDENDRDERYWAAAELFRTTGREVYHTYVKSVYKADTVKACSFGWENTGGYARIAYLFGEPAQQDETVFAYMRHEMLRAADGCLEVRRQDGYCVTLKPEHYEWGSNMRLLNDAMLLLLCGRLHPNSGYVEAALDNFHYLLGRNCLNLCYVTGFGAKTVQNPHHRPSFGDGVENPVPGLVCGGANRNLQDEYAVGHLQNLPPARCFADHVDCYSTNEITIYWNAPAVFVAAFFDSNGK